MKTENYSLQLISTRSITHLGLGRMLRFLLPPSPCSYSPRAAHSLDSTAFQEGGGLISPSPGWGTVLSQALAPFQERQIASSWQQ